MKYFSFTRILDLIMIVKKVLVRLKGLALVASAASVVWPSLLYDTFEFPAWSMANFLLYMSIYIITERIESDRLNWRYVLTTNGTGMLQGQWMKWLSLNWKTVWWFVWYGFPQCTQGFWGDWRLTQDVNMGGSKTPTVRHYWQEVPYYMAWGTTWERAEMRGLSCHNHQTEHYRWMNPAECWWNETLQNMKTKGLVTQAPDRMLKLEQ